MDSKYSLNNGSEIIYKSSSSSRGNRSRMFGLVCGQCGQYKFHSIDKWLILENYALCKECCYDVINAHTNKERTVIINEA